MEPGEAAHYGLCRVSSDVMLTSFLAGREYTDAQAVSQPSLLAGASVSLTHKDELFRKELLFYIIG